MNETSEVSDASVAPEGDRQPERPTAAQSSEFQRQLAWVATAILFYFVLKVSWVAEDSYITLRTVDNLLNGYGLRWNVAERVQTYTHPLWMLVLIPFKAILPSSMMALFVPCWLASFAALALLFRLARGPFAIVVTFCVLGISPSFIDYGSSGLECALSYLLIVCLLRTLPSEGATITRFAGFLGLALLNRLDLVLLLAPLAITEIVRARGSRRFLKVTLAFAPLLSWLVFASAYYGSPLPNTYFAKVETGLPVSMVLTQSLRYFLDIALYEPLTLAAGLSGIILGVRSRHIDKPAFYLAVGILIHLAYLFKIGGDYMNARFLAPYVLISAWIAQRSTDRARPQLQQLQRAWPRASLMGLGAAAVLLFAADVHSFSSRKAEILRPSTIADERLFHMASTGVWSRLWGYLKGHPFEVPHAWANHGRKLAIDQPSGRVFVHESIGFMGFYAGPRVHIVDRLGLGDAFMARMPVSEFRSAGHADRKVPSLYIESIEQRRNLFPPGRLHDLYDDVMLITRSKRLLSWQRLAAIWRLHTGSYSDVAQPDLRILSGELDNAIASIRN